VKAEAALIVDKIIMSLLQSDDAKTKTKIKRKGVAFCSGDPKHRKKQHSYTI